MLDVLKTRDYRLLWTGQGVSHLGDQFHLVALPWLVLTLTRDPLQLGIVLALAGVPRAALMLLGGAFADRHSPRAIMLVSDALRFALTAALAAAVLTGTVQMWMVYLLALAFGVVSGFFLPAAESALPRVVHEDKLEAGNALMMGVTSLAQFVGPAAAGILIGLFGSQLVAGEKVASLAGIGIAFAVDGLSFAVSALCLALMAGLPALGAGAEQHPLAAVLEGMRFTFSRAPFRWMLAMIGGANFLLMGPLFVGLPVLAQTRFAEGALGYGVILASYALGNVVGMVGAGSMPRLSSRTFTAVVVGFFLAFAAVIASLAFIGSAWTAAGLMVVLGLGNGYIAVTIISILQRETPKEMLGRVMSMLMLAMVGLAPVSQLAAGAIIKLGPAALFVPAGAGVALIGLFAGARHRSWSLDKFEQEAAERLGDAVVEPA
jgi:MFS family permease